MEVRDLVWKLTVILALILFSLQGHCQIDSLTFGPEPIGGVQKVALEYYKIDFTKEQREILRDVEIEFIYTIDEKGTATLEEVHGLDDEAILDSLFLATRNLPKFYPRTVNGVKENSLYFVKLRFPSYRRAIDSQFNPGIFRFRVPRYKEFEYIHTSGEKIDVLFGGVANAFVGNLGNYLNPGGGMKVDIFFIGKKGVGGGLVMNFYGNKLKQDYPLVSQRGQNPAPPTLLVGAGVTKRILEKERSEVNVQLELNYAIQNVTPRLGYNDHDWVQLKGFSPGFLGNYLIQLGKNSTSLFYGSPTVVKHYLNVHAAIRPVFFNISEATGVMLEVGLSYRFRSHFVEEYKLKPEFDTY